MSATITAQTTFEHATPERAAESAAPMVVALASVTSNDMPPAASIEPTAETAMSPQRDIASTIEPVAEVVHETAAATTTEPVATRSVVQAQARPPVPATHVVEPIEPHSPPPSTVAVAVAVAIEPAADAQATLNDAGLVRIETDRTKAEPAQPEPEPVKLGRPRPERPRAADEGLVQIETDK